MKTFLYIFLGSNLIVAFWWIVAKLRRRYLPKKPYAPLLTPEGRDLARKFFLFHRFASRIPWLGKYAIGIAGGFALTAILKEGAIEDHARRSKAKMSKMRNRISPSGGQTPPTLPEM